jgi:REP element-mobilizing transposase RayT
MPAGGSLDFRRDFSLEAHFKPLVDSHQNGTPSASLTDATQPEMNTRNPRMQKSDPETEILQDTRQHTFTDGARKIVLEPVSPAIYNLDYACVLVPRFPQHHITGDLLDRLGEWVPQICIAYAWRLEYISVRPDYLQWIVNVPPVTAPASLMRILRQHTSERIFSEFPRFKKENPSNEFWAPGYLIMGGSQPPPAQLIKDFITQTRQKQGIPLQFNQ